MTTEEIEEFQDAIPRRVVVFCNRAPRTWDEIVGCLAGVSDPSRATLAVEQAQLVHVATQALWEMVRDGRLIREPAADPRYDTYVPR